MDAASADTRTLDLLAAVLNVRARARDNSRDEGAVVRRMRDPNGVRGPVYGYAEMRAAILRN